MRYYHVQSIVACYSDPVEMTNEVMQDLTAHDIFSSRTDNLADLEKTCLFIAELCKLARFKKIKPREDSWRS
jgi:hypothetical protein